MRWRMIAILALVSLGGCSPPSATPPPKTAPMGTGYGPVQPRNIVGAHLFRATGPGGDEFAWSLDDTSFTFEESGRAIPSEVLESVLGPGGSAKRIRGRWKLSGDALALSGITADDKGGFADVTLHLFRTPVVRTHFGKTQYVLVPR